MKITLKTPHTHAGEPIGPGPADLPPLDALWLKSQGLIDEPARAVLAELKKLGIAAPADLVAAATAHDTPDQSETPQ